MKITDALKKTGRAHWSSTADWYAAVSYDHILWWYVKKTKRVLAQVMFEDIVVDNWYPCEDEDKKCKACEKRITQAPEIRYSMEEHLLRYHCTCKKEEEENENI